MLLASLGAMLILSCQKEYSFEAGTGNQPPVAAAGADQVINLPIDSALLDGRLSSDPDGRIIAWRWSGISGPAAARIVQPDSPSTVLDELVAGSYQLSLQVTDDQGLTDTDTVQITVQSGSPVNRPPVACAGPDQTITLPINTVTLDGRCSLDPDNDIAIYLWSHIIGPSSFRITNPDQPQTPVTDLEAGSYVFQLTVRDASGLISIDTMRVTVNPSPINTDSLDVYVAGNEFSGPVYWKNGQSIPLEIAFGQNGHANAITVVGDDVYVAGWEGDFLDVKKNRAKYWKNGQEVFLTGATGAGANDIVVSGGDVYVAGWEVGGWTSRAKYWKNGTEVTLSDGSRNAQATGIVVVGGDVYVSGHEEDVARYWRNGQPVTLSGAIYPSYAYDISVVGADVYLVGIQRGKATYWRNGQAVPLSGGSETSVARSIFVTGGDVFVAGDKGDYGQTVTRYWKNGQETLLSTLTEPMLATSIFVWGNDVYVTGFTYTASNKSGYWRNGQFVQIGPSDAQASSILVMRR
jgi:hypothetical protein